MTCSIAIKVCWCFLKRSNFKTEKFWVLRPRISIYASLQLEIRVMLEKYSKFFRWCIHDADEKTYPAISNKHDYVLLTSLKFSRSIIWKRQFLVGIFGVTKVVQNERVFFWKRFWRWENVQKKSQICRIPFFKLLRVSIVTITMKNAKTTLWWARWWFYSPIRVYGKSKFLQTKPCFWSCTCRRIVFQNFRFFNLMQLPIQMCFGVTSAELYIISNTDPICFFSWSKMLNWATLNSFPESEREPSQSLRFCSVTPDPVQNYGSQKQLSLRNPWFSVSALYIPGYGSNRTQNFTKKATGSTGSNPWPLTGHFIFLSVYSCCICLCPDKVSEPAVSNGICSLSWTNGNGQSDVAVIKKAKWKLKFFRCKIIPIVSFPK